MANLESGREEREEEEEEEEERWREVEERTRDSIRGVHFCDVSRSESENGMFVADPGNL